MSLYRRATQRDTAEGPIAEALQACGWTVLKLSIRDAPDLVVGKDGWNEFIQVKTGRDKETPGQVRWRERWRGGRIWILRTVDEAMDFNRVMGIRGERRPAPLLESAG